MADQDSNNGLYFIVGGLLVAAVIFAFILWNPAPNSAAENMNATAPAAGSPSMSYERTDQTTTTSPDNPGQSTTTTTRQTEQSTSE